MENFLDGVACRVEMALDGFDEIVIRNRLRDIHTAAELIAAFFLRSNVIKITLLLFQTHVAKPEDAFELWSDTVAKVRQRERFDVQRIGARQNRIGVLMFPIFFQSDGALFRNNELRSVLKTLEPASDAPQSGL